MEIQNIHNPRFKQQISKENWNKLGPARQKAFRILNSEDIKHEKVNVISNDIKKASKLEDPIKEVKQEKTSEIKPEKDREKKREQKE